MLHDAFCIEQTSKSPRMLVAWWIMAAWAYDVASDPIISDAVFDRVAAELFDKWDTIEHQHKSRLDRTMLKSAIAISGNYPDRAIGAAMRLIAATESPPPRVVLPSLEDAPDIVKDVVLMAIGDIPISDLPQAAQDYLRDHRANAQKLAARSDPPRQDDLFGGLDMPPNTLRK